MRTTESLAIEEVQPQAAAQAAAIEEVQPQAAAQAAAATPTVVAAPAVVAVPVAGGTLSTRVRSAIPARELPVFSGEEIANYQGRLMHYGLDQKPKRWIKSPYEWVGKRDAVKDHMLRLYEAAPWRDWDVTHVPKNCNEQAFVATTELMRLFQSKGKCTMGCLNCFA